MDLTTHEEELVTQTFAEIAPQVDRATEMFYDRLFEVEPSTKGMFGEGDQRFEMFNILATAVKSLSYSGTTGPDLNALGRRHVTYGVTLKQFDVVRDVLIWTFEQILGEQFTPQARVTWVKVYDALRDRVIQGNYTSSASSEQVDVATTNLHTGKLDVLDSDKSGPQTGNQSQNNGDDSKPPAEKPDPPTNDIPSP